MPSNRVPTKEPQLKQSQLNQSKNRPTHKITIVGAGIVGALEAYFAYKDALAKRRKVRITMFDKNSSITDTTAFNIAPSLTPDEIMSVVPPAPILIEKLGVLFSSSGGGIRVDDVPGVNDSPAKDEFISQVAAYNKDPAAHTARSQALLKLGKISMDLWQKIYDDADPELKQILEESNFQPCHEPKLASAVLHDGYKIDLICDIPNAALKAQDMQKKYADLGYYKCKILTPDEVTTLDPSLADFCGSHSYISKSGARVWKNDTVALFKPGGCLDATVFLPKFYAYLERNLGTYRNEAGTVKNCFRLKFNREVNGLVLQNNYNNLAISALKYNANKTKTDKHKCEFSDYVFCPGEAVGTLKRLGLDEPAYAGFVGASLKLLIPVPNDKRELYKKFNHCMDVHREAVGLAWQARHIDGKISISVAGTKAFYADQKPHKDQAFALNRNLLQLNMINDVLPEFVSLALGRDTKGQKLTANDLEVLEKSGIAKRWVGTRAVAFDGFPTLGMVARKGREVENARTITHLGSGGVSFGPAAVLYSRAALNHRPKNAFEREILDYADPKRKMAIYQAKL